MNIRDIAANEAVAVEVLRCAISWDKDARPLGNVRAEDLARLAAAVIDTCPKCGATAWVNIDCDLCRVCSHLLDPANSEGTEVGS